MAEQIKEGIYDRFGANRLADGICFTFEGEKGSTCAVRLYDRQTQEHAPTYRDILVPEDYCVGAVHSICVCGLDAERFDYNYVIDGKVVVDPYARRIIGRERWADRGRREQDYEVRSGFDFSEFDWKDDRHPEVSRADMLLYKLHVRGFTKNGNLKTAKKGSFAAVAEKIDYLKELGVTTVELMPVYEFEEFVMPKHEDTLMNFDGWSPQAITGYRLMQQKELEKKEKELPTINFWGYGSGNYFAPKASYALGKPASTEFKKLVYALHAAGMECILEMSFDEQTNPVYIVDVLRYWVLEYHVDGFHLLASEAAVANVVHDVLLRRSKIFARQFPAEVWELQDGYPHLYLYNDDFLYTARKLINHQDGNMVEFLNQQRKQHPQIGFVNYFANNNGFTLADVFCYATKHNESNGEGGVDGNDWNYSVNCGAEGSSRKKKIVLQRGRLMRLAIASVLLSQGVPLIYAGDEFGNSQNGNNNAYNQDNQIGWVNWKCLERNTQYFEYVKALLSLRRSHKCIRKEEVFQMSSYDTNSIPDLSYHGGQAWSRELYPSMQSIGVAYGGIYSGEKEDLYIGWNFSQNKISLAFPKAIDGKKWRLVLGDGMLSEDNDCLELDACSVSVLSTVSETIPGRKKTKGNDHGKRN